MGADIVLNHHDDLVQQLHSEHGEFVDFIFVHTILICITIR